MTAEQLVKRKAVMKRYAATAKGRACFLRAAYKSTDDCDLTTKEVLEIISLPCHYCGTEKHHRGLDRIDNGYGHVRGNVLPCCLPCNTARANFFSVEEMQTIGEAIRSIWADRESANVPLVQPSALRIASSNMKALKRLLSAQNKGSSVTRNADHPA